MSDVLLETEDLKMHFPIKGGLFSRTVGQVKAVDGVDLKVRQGETLGIVGESGCGKSTLGRAILRLLEPTSGHVYFSGEDILAYNRKQLLQRRRKMQMVFQDPFASLNPRMKVGDIIAAPLKTYKVTNNLKSRVLELMEIVGLKPEHYHRYPHEFSGGQRQRIGIARALALRPKLLVCDEPISGLDVSIQAQVINLLQDLQKEFDLTYIFIAHDLSAVKHIADRIAVMYLGRVVEEVRSSQFFEQAAHPYTRALLSAIPKPDPKQEKTRQRIVLQGDVPSPAHPPKGCPFHTRCPNVQEYCRSHVPVIKEVGKEHRLSCFFPVQP
jgi:oligopeptide/dipeptide ABC transporter ATP-binding protein